MLGRLSAGLVIALVSFSTAAQDAQAAGTKQSQAKTTQRVAAKTSTKHSSKRVIAHRGRGKSYLVPPPPPYAPSILPELAYARSRGYHRKSTTVAVQEEKKDAFEELGVQAVDGYEDPQPVKKGNGVVTWNNKG
jgi:hypothetical protein